jgi:hypothetical protein
LGKERDDLRCRVRCCRKWRGNLMGMEAEAKIRGRREGECGWELTSMIWRLHLRVSPMLKTLDWESNKRGLRLSL